jgi:hypothetical protein
MTCSLARAALQVSLAEKTQLRREAWTLRPLAYEPDYPRGCGEFGFRLEQLGRASE